MHIKKQVAQLQPRNLTILYNIYIYIPRTQLTSIFEGQPFKTRPFPIKTRVVWVPGIYILNIQNILMIFRFVKEFSGVLSGPSLGQVSIGDLLFLKSHGEPPNHPQGYVYPQEIAGPNSRPY